jgi:hypothetical protein
MLGSVTEEHSFLDKTLKTCDITGKLMIYRYTRSSIHSARDQAVRPSTQLHQHQLTKHFSRNLQNYQGMENMPQDVVHHEFGAE